MVFVWVRVTLSPEADSVAVGLISDSNPIVPAELALNTPAFASVTGRESDPLAVNVAVNVDVWVPVVWAYVACLRIRPPP